MNLYTARLSASNICLLADLTDRDSIRILQPSEDGPPTLLSAPINVTGKFRSIFHVLFDSPDVTGEGDYFNTAAEG